MAKARFKSVAEYIACQAEAVRPVLEQVRTAIRRALPEAEEAISYDMPAYKLSGERLDLFRRVEEALRALRRHQRRLSDV